MTESYSSLVLEHFRHPRNKGRHSRPNASAEGANPLCGDRIRIECEVSGARVVSVMFTGDACAICVASASLLTGRVRGMAVPEVMLIVDAAAIDALEGAVPPARRRCATLPLDTLRQALAPFVPVSIVCPIVLAAGAGRRFGGDKMLAPIDGQPMIRVVASAYAELCGRVTVVIRPDDRLIAALEGLAADIVVNDRADEGIATSIVAGVSSNLDRPAVMIALGDEPRVDRGLVMQVMQLWHETRAPIVVPRYMDERQRIQAETGAEGPRFGNDARKGVVAETGAEGPRFGNGEPGHPVLFDEKTYDQLMELRGDRGARSLIESGDRVLSVEVQSARPTDVDTAQDLERL